MENVNHIGNTLCSSSYEDCFSNNLLENDPYSDRFLHCHFDFLIKKPEAKVYKSISKFVVFISEMRAIFICFFLSPGPKRPPLTFPDNLTA